MKGNEIQCNEIKYTEMKKIEVSIRFGRKKGLPEADKRFGRQIWPCSGKYQFYTISLCNFDTFSKKYIKPFMILIIFRGRRRKPAGAGMRFPLGILTFVQNAMSRFRRGHKNGFRRVMKNLI